jgi:hypothetical protein
MVALCVYTCSLGHEGGQRKGKRKKGKRRGEERRGEENIPGNHHNTKHPHKNENAPYVKKIACQLLNGLGGLSISVKQYASSPPTICCPPFIIYQ